MQREKEQVDVLMKALSSEKRRLILSWIINPTDHFPPQRDGDLVEDGVCIGFITDKIGLSQPTVTSHMQILAKAGLVSSKPVKNWIFYKPDKEAIRAALKQLEEDLGL